MASVFDIIDVYSFEYLKGWLELQFAALKSENMQTWCQNLSIIPCWFLKVCFLVYFYVAWQSFSVYRILSLRLSAEAAAHSDSGLSPMAYISFKTCLCKIFTRNVLSDIAKLSKWPLNTLYEPLVNDNTDQPSWSSDLICRRRSFLNNIAKSSEWPLIPEYPLCTIGHR